MTPEGLFCKAGGFHIDPSRKVDIALVTHAHSDHARKGSKQYFCARPGRGLLERRLGSGDRILPVDYGEILEFGDVKVSFHPAGHILGSAQIRVEYQGEVWVVSGDYKRQPDPTCQEFEVVPCDVFFTEATFGHPIYEWDDPVDVSRGILDWWRENAEAERNALLYCYSLGKMQRILAELAKWTDRRVYLFGEGVELTELYRKEGVKMLPTRSLDALAGSSRMLEGELILASHSINRTEWMERLGDYESAFASGWMVGAARRFNGMYDRGFGLSDHADWPALVRTVEQTGAQRVVVLHSREGHALIKHLRKNGIDAASIEDEFSTRRRAPVQLKLL